MTYDAEVLVNRTTATGRCLIGDCNFECKWSSERAINAVKGVKRELSKHRAAAKHKLGRWAVTFVGLERGIEA